MNAENTIGALISAAGMSTRMGQLKQTLPIGSTTFIEMIINRFFKAGVSIVVVVAGYRAREIRDTLAGYPVVILENTEYETTQMLDSVKIGLSYLQDKCDRLFFTPVDVPVFNDSTLKAELLCQSPLVFPRTNGRTGHPILIDAQLIPQILLYQGDGGLKGAFETLHVEPCCVEVNDQGSLMDADTPQDYEKIRDLYQKGSVKETEQ